MKTQQKNTTMKSFKQVGAVLFFLLVAQFGFAQDPGGGPDGPPPAVPFDDYLNIILAAVGIIVALIYFRKSAKRSIA